MKSFLKEFRFEIFLAIFAIAVLGYLAVLQLRWFETPEGKVEIEKREMEQRTQEMDTVAREIRYLKDARTGLCFAYYYWGGIGNGGPALALVPCDAVKDQLVPSHKDQAAR